MRKILSITLLFIITLCQAQEISREALVFFEMAEEKFEGKRYDNSLDYLKKAEDILGRSNPQIAYLRIMVYREMTNELKSRPLEFKAFATYPLFSNAIKKFEKTGKIDVLGEDKLMEVTRIKIQLEEFLKLYERSDIQLQLGHNYNYENNGFKKDHQEAIKWYLKAAKNGNAEAELCLGDRYFKGENIEKNEHEGMKWYLKAVENNNPSASLSIAGIYFRGSSEYPKNYVKAEEWFKKTAILAVDQKDLVRESQAYAGLGDLYSLADNKQLLKAIEYFEKEIKINDKKSESSHNLANIYYLGSDGIPKNYVKAAKYFEDSYIYFSSPEYIKERSDSYVKYFVEAYSSFLIDMYSSGGFGLKKNNEKVKYWTELKTMKTRNIIENFENEIKTMDIKSKKYFMKSVGIAQIFYSGKDGVQKDYAKSIKYLEEAYKYFSSTEYIKENGEESLKRFLKELAPSLIEMYSKGGFGVKTNLEKVKYWTELNLNQK